MVGKKDGFRRSYPEPVKRRFRAMQDDLPYKVTLVEVSGHYYLYKLVSELNDKTGRYRLRRGQCIGKITDNGVYVPSKIRSELDIETAKAVILANGGKVVMPRERQQTFDYNGIQLTEQEERILTCLSMNARLTAPQIGKIVGMPAEQVTSKVKHLENLLGIKYVADIRLDPLGYSHFVILVKFQGEIPNPKFLQEELEKEPHVLFAAFTSGSYDLIIFIVAKTSREVTTTAFELNKLPSLRKFTAKWFTSTFIMSYGYLPLRDEVFKLLQDDVWHRTKETSKPESNQLTNNEFLFLRELNKSAVSPISDIERNAKLQRGNGRYLLERLKKRSIVNTATVTLRKLTVKYNAGILSNIINEELFAKTRPSLLKQIIEEDNEFIINRFSLIGDIAVPRGFILFTPVKQEGELEAAVSKLNDFIKGIESETLVISHILVGTGLLYRRFDNTYSSQCERLATIFKESEFIALLNKKQDYNLTTEES